MNDLIPPVQSLKTLCLSSIIAIFIAAVVLVVAVFPAEFGKDPTGLGKKLGLLVLSETATVSDDPTEIQTRVQANSKKQTAVVGKEPTASENINDKETGAQHAVANNRYHENNTVTIEIPAKKGLEYKFHLRKGEEMDYSWQTDGTKIYFDFHGEPKGDTTGYFKSFVVKTDHQSQGNFSAPFEGSHGWYWENSSSKPIKVTLVTSGYYDIIGIIGAH